MWWGEGSVKIFRWVKKHLVCSAWLVCPSAAAGYVMKLAVVRSCVNISSQKELCLISPPSRNFSILLPDP